MSKAYEKSGVSIKRGNEAVRRIKEMVKKIGVQEIGKFGGFFPLQEEFSDPVLVSSADGVGTKLKVAFMAGIHNTVGQDLVNHCVNDILVYGAKPLFFLDYLALAKVEPDVVAKIISGILDGCVENDFILLGGETAEMPGFYQPGEYDLAGFIVGILSRQKAIDGSKIKAGDLLIALRSSGLHTNGYSLARQILFEKLKLKTDSIIPGLNITVSEELLKIHRSYLKVVSPLLKQDLIKGMAHITGGGILENLPRIFPSGVGAVIEKTWPVPPIFEFLTKEGKISSDESYRVFNMGVGMILVIDRRNLSRVEKELKDQNEQCYLIGEIIASKKENFVRIEK